MKVSTSEESEQDGVDEVVGELVDKVEDQTQQNYQDGVASCHKLRATATAYAL